MKKPFFILPLILLLCIPVAAGAWTQELANDYPQANAIYLWMDPAKPQVDSGVSTFGGGHTDWILASNQPMQQFIEGPAKPGGTAGLYLNFTSSQSQPFSFQWAEVQWNDKIYSLLGSGSLEGDSSGWGATN